MKSSTLLAGMSVVLSGACFAQSAAEKIGAECAPVVDLSARLRCYDEHMAALGYKIGVPTSSEPALAAAPASAQASAISAAARAAGPANTQTSVVSVTPVPAQSPTPTVASSSSSTSAASGHADFGSTPELIRKQQPANIPPAPKPAMTARVKSVSERAHGELKIELDNDQVWVQTQTTGAFSPPAVGETITIRHGALGSFVLSRASGPGLRVERIR